MKEEQIFHQVLEQPVERRAAFLEAACGADITLRQRIAILLSAQENPGSFLQHPICGVADLPILADQILERIGSQIGPYKLLEEIGQGGMGTVYMAEQKMPVRRCVALKIVKAGMDSRQVLARFDGERQALAMMDHPGIARIIDAGTTELGRPYFVMELVRGIPINEFCDQNRLTVRERLELFLKVCQAVQHAHQKGIIHRDLKPTNVLVTRLDVVAVPKIIDFGIAKAFGSQLTDHTQVTGFAQFLGTPQYMSPEQAEMNQLGVDTRSDVYSLGVVFYELLTGSTPFDKHTFKMSNFDELRRILREEEPPNPSSRMSTMNAQALSTVSERRGSDPRRMVNIIRGELDWIVMKALEKDRERRYESAAGLAADIQRYLQDEPVLACPPSVGYRLRKHARRNRVAIVTTSLISIAILIGTGASIWQAIRAAAATQVAIEQKQTAEHNLQAAMNALEQMLANVGNPELADVPKFQEIRAKILHDTISFYERFKLDSGSSPKVDYRAAKLYLELGVFAQQMRPESEQVINAYAAGLGLAESLVLRHPERNDFRELTAELHLACADYWWLPKPIATEKSFAKALKHFEDAEVQYAYLSLANPGNDDYEERQSFVFARMCMLFRKQSPTDPRGFEYAERATELGRLDHSWMVKLTQPTAPGLAREYWLKMIDEYRSHPDKPTGLLWSLFETASSFVDDDPELAEWVWQEANKMSFELLETFPSNRQYNYNFEQASWVYSQFLLQAERRPLALAKVDTLINSDSAFHKLRSRVIANGISNSGDQLQTLNDSIRRFPTQSDYYRVRAEVLEKKGDLGSALTDLNHTLEINGNDRRAYSNRGKLYSSLGHYQNAVDDYTRSLMMTGGVDQDYLLKRRASAYFELGQYAEALSDLRQAIDQAPQDLSVLTSIAQAKVAACPDKNFGLGMIALADHAIEIAKDVPHAYEKRGYLYHAMEHHAQASADFSKSLELAPDDATLLNNLAWHYATCLNGNLRDAPKAMQLATKAVELKPLDGTVWNTLGVAHYRNNNWQDAIIALQKSMEFRLGGDSFDWFVLAMAYWQLDRKQEARVWYDKAVEWMDKNSPKDNELLRFRAEAAELLGVSKGLKS